MDDEERFPAYVHNAWHTGAKTYGPQCSASGEYCFACASAGGGENNPLDNIKSMVGIMIGQDKELPVIVLAVEEVYNETARPHNSYTTAGGELITAPAWSKNSISTHLIGSSEFPELFQAVIGQTYRTICSRINDTLLTAAGDVDEAKRKAWVETTLAFKKWNERSATKKVRL